MTEIRLTRLVLFFLLMGALANPFTADACSRCHRRSCQGCSGTSQNNRSLNTDTRDIGYNHQELIRSLQGVRSLNQTNPQLEAIHQRLLVIEGNQGPKTPPAVRTVGNDRSLGIAAAAMIVQEVLGELQKFGGTQLTPDQQTQNLITSIVPILQQFANGATPNPSGQPTQPTQPPLAAANQAALQSLPPEVQLSAAVGQFSLALKNYNDAQAAKKIADQKAAEAKKAADEKAAADQKIVNDQLQTSLKELADKISKVAP